MLFLLKAIMMSPVSVSEIKTNISEIPLPQLVKG